LRAYAQKDPLNEYKSEAFEMFNGMLNELDERVTLVLSHMQLELSTYDEAALFDRDQPDTVEIYQDPASAGAFDGDTAQYESGFENLGEPQPMISRQGAVEINPDDPATWGKVGRNASCPCGSGKKYKHCHGAQ
ncbi:MAG: SEC-C metal-binding domain-containing protein, partial [Proteobacteria bacterium]|nr:SEC-C metal-binding domain-containing protein [Pseudomonadota bacterium]